MTTKKVVRKLRETNCCRSGERGVIHPFRLAPALCIERSTHINKYITVRVIRLRLRPPVKCGCADADDRRRKESAVFGGGNHGEPFPSLPSLPFLSLLPFSSPLFSSLPSLPSPSLPSTLSIPHPPSPSPPLLSLRSRLH